MKKFERKETPIDYLIDQGEKQMLVEQTGKTDAKTSDRMVKVYKTLRGEA